MSVRLTESEFDALASYNRRRSRGHLPTYEEWWAMAILQWRWNVDKREQYLDQGAIPLLGGGYLYIPESTNEDLVLIPHLEWIPTDA
jgi:hypothetical protein